MTENVKITALEIENVKRIKAVAIDCDGKPLTVIGGRNGQGKTSVLDAIMWTLGGDRFRPSDPLREGTTAMATKITLTNGVVVERRGADGSLKVTSPGRKGGQQLLNEFVSAIALDLPRFMNASDKERANMLLEIYPDLGAELNRLNQEAKRIYDERHALGVIVERKKKYAEELPFHDDAPNELLTGTEMTQRLQDQLRMNAENDRLRRELQSVRIKRDAAAKTVADLRARLADAEALLAKADEDLARATTSAESLIDEDTSAIQRELEEIDAINAKVRQNLDKARAEAEAADLSHTYNDLTRELEDVRTQRIRLLSSITLPLPDLSIDIDGFLVYRSRRWDCMSGAEQLRVAVAICASVKPECGFVLLDGLEAMDKKQLRDFAGWLAEQNLQAIATRVSDGDECSLIIDDGQSAGAGSTSNDEYEFK
jgi:hypothetical protein